jgi:hypothetical protein
VVRYGHAAVAVLTVVAGLGILAFGISRWLYAFRAFGPLVVWRFSSQWIALATVMLAASVVIWIWLALIRISAVRPSPEGIEIRRGLRRKQVRWEGISAIYISATHDQLLGLGIGTRASLKIKLSSGKGITITSAIELLADLAQSIKQFAYPRMLRGYSRLLQHGKVAKFGSITLTNHGFNWRKRSIPWQFISGANLQAGKLEISTKPNQSQAPVSIPIRKIPNVDICLQLIQHLQIDASS